MSGTAQGSEQAQAAPDSTTSQAAPAAVAAPAPAPAAAAPATDTPNAAPAPAAAAAPTATTNAAAEALDVSDLAAARAEITTAVLEGRLADAKAMRAKVEGAKAATKTETETQNPPAQAAVETAPPADDPNADLDPDPAWEDETDPEGVDTLDAGAQPQPGDEPAAIDPNAPPEKQPKRVRMESLPDDDRKAFTKIHSLMLGGMNIAEATEFVLGKAAAAAGGEAAPAPSAADRAAAEAAAIQSSPTVQALAEKVKDLKAARRTALEESAGLADDAVQDLDEQLSEANGELAAAKVAERQRVQQSTQHEAQVRDAWSRSEAAAVAKFPAMAEKNSLLNLMISGLAAAAQDPQSDDYQASRLPNAPEYFAQKAAKILNISPSPAATAEQARKNGTKAPAKAAPAAVPARPASPTANPPAVRPASGAKGSAPPAPAKSRHQVIDEKLAQTEAVITGRAPAPRRAGMGMIVR